MTMRVPHEAGDDIAIVGYASIEARRRVEIDQAVERIFFAASSVQSFRDDAHRSAFQWLWLGRYLAEEPDDAFVALRAGEPCGYLVGSLTDPAPRAAFDELTYFRDFAAETARYPAHLHINVDACVRGQGIGARLIHRFAGHASAQHSQGMHIVTGDGMRNVGFYAQLGFREVARVARNGGVVVMLAKALDGVGDS